jgi:lysophospholipase L1-like esterase
MRVTKNRWARQRVVGEVRTSRLRSVLAVLLAAWVAFVGSGSGANQTRAEDTALPAWIWGDPNAATSAIDGQCDFRKEFQLTRPQSGKLRIACDNRYTLRLNGRLIGMGDDWQQWNAYDVSAVLRDGANELLVRCRNEQVGPAGLCLELIVQQADTTAEGATDDSGSSQRATIVTDETWQAKMQAAGTWDPTVEKRTPWAKAYVLGRYGITMPWGSAVAEAPTQRVIQGMHAINEGPFQLQDGDRVVLLGNTLIERAQRYGYLEAAFTTAAPQAHVVFRNLGWSGDTVFGHARARFGGVEDGFEHLETHVYAEKPTKILIAYGTNESYAGPDGLDGFQDGLHRLLDVLSGTGAELILVTPTPLENLGPPLPDPTPHNDVLKRYRDAIVQIAADRGCRVVDLFERIKPHAVELGIDQSLTENGIHLSALGYWAAAQTMLAELKLAAAPISVQVDAQIGSAEAIGAELPQVEVQSDRVQFTLRPPTLPIAAPRQDAAMPTPSWPPRMLTVTNLAPGNYRLTRDGETLTQGSAAEWATGMSWQVPDTRDRADRLLRQIVAKNELYFHRWRPQNETYLFLFRKHEQGNNAVEIPQFDPLIEAAEQTIGELRLPVSESFELIRLPSGNK